MKIKYFTNQKYIYVLIIYQFSKNDITLFPSLFQTDPSPMILRASWFFIFPLSWKKTRSRAALISFSKRHGEYIYEFLPLVAAKTYTLDAS